MISVNEITQIEFGVTSKCNAACPLCARQLIGTSNIDPNIIQSDLSFENFKIITEGLGSNSKNINADFCGTTGDIIAHPDAENIIKYASTYYKEANLHTNGSAKSVSFWQNIAKLKNVHVIFSIDGLSDTNHLYRINTNFDTIIKNAKIFIDAGGYAIWKFIKFSHNEHQVDKAKELAKELGFKKFQSIASTRWILPKVDIKKDSYKNKINKTAVQTQLSPASESNKIKSAWYRDFSYKEINCRTIADNYLYIDENAKLWPCCHFHSHYAASRPAFINYWKKIENLYGNNFNSLLNNTVDDLLNHEYFQEYLKNSFKDSKEVCYRCIQACAKNRELQRQEDYKKEQIS